MGPRRNADEGRRKPGRVPTSCQECRRLKLKCDNVFPCKTCVKRGCQSICPDGSLAAGRGNRMILANTTELHTRIEVLCQRVRELEVALRIMHRNYLGNGAEEHPLLREEMLAIKRNVGGMGEIGGGASGSGSAEGRGGGSEEGGTGSRSASQGDSPNPASGPGSAAQREKDKARPDESPDDSLIDAFGTLMIAANGETTFLGKTARAEYLIHAPYTPAPALSQSTEDFPYLSAGARLLDMVETPQEDAALAEEVWARLPPWVEAVALCEAYLGHGRYSWSTLPRAELCGMYMTGLYAHPKEMRTASRSCWSALSLLFAVFALGALFEPPTTPPSPSNLLGSPSSPHNPSSGTTPPPIHPTAHAYFRTARAALALAQPMLKTTATGVLTLVHLAQWLEHAQAYGELTINGGVPSPAGAREIVPTRNVGGGASGWVWAYMGLAARLGTSIGLHLNSARWKLDEETAQRRSRIFWQLFTHDTWVSFSFGRPPSLNASFIDCALPKDEDEYTNSQGGKELGFHSWTWQYARLLHNVMTTAFGAKVPPYTMVLDLDRKIRDFPVPSYLQPNCNELEMPAPPQELIIQRFIVLSSKEATLLNLHRTYFAQALSEQPHDLLRHRYGPSVMATYRSAWRLIEALKSPTRRSPGLAARHNLAWSNALSAAIVMCLMVTRAPSSKLATSCMEELVTVEDLFTAASPSCRAAANLLESIKRLRIKGQEALDQSHSSDPLLTPAELDRLGGKTYYISGRTCIVPDSASPATTSDSDASLEEPGPMPTDFLMMDNLHPRIVQDMKAFEFDMSTYNLPYGVTMFDAPPLLDPQAMTQDAGIYGVDLFPFMAERLMQQQYQQQVQQPQHTGEQPVVSVEGAFSPGPAAALDATWQNFVEQLGF